MPSWGQEEQLHEQQEGGQQQGGQQQQLQLPLLNNQFIVELQQALGQAAGTVFSSSSNAIAAYGSTTAAALPTEEHTRLGHAFERWWGVWQQSQSTMPAAV
jgi:hypothetical protein